MKKLGFIKMYRQLLRSEKISISAKGMLGILKTYTYKGETYPSIETLARAANVNIKTAKKLLHELRDIGAIVTSARYSGGCRRSSYYLIDDDKWSAKQVLS